jgi:undecaprenyl-diphosphatase
MQRPRSGVPWAVFLAIALLLAFAAIALLVSEGRSEAFDRAVILAVRNMAGSPEPAWLDETVRNITSLGSVVVVGLVAGTYAGYLLLSGQRSSAILMVISVGGGIVLNELLKLIFDRPRPDLALPFIRVFSSSFPSGHAALSSVAYLTIGALAAHASPAGPTRTYLLTAATFLVFLIGTSRVYLGVHYPTDVVAGWCIGCAWALTCWHVAHEIERRQFGNGRQSR